MKQALLLVGPILGSLLLASLIVSATSDLATVPPPEEGDPELPVSQSPVAQPASPSVNSQSVNSQGDRAANSAADMTPVASGADPTVVVTPPQETPTDVVEVAAVDDAAATSGNAPAPGADQESERPIHENGFPRSAQILGEASESTNCRRQPWGDVVGTVVARERVTATGWQADDRGEPWFRISSAQLPQDCWIHDSRLQLASTAIQPSHREGVEDPSEADAERLAASQAIASRPQQTSPATPFPRQGQIAGDRTTFSNCRSEPWGEVVAALTGGERVTIGDRTTDGDGTVWFRVTLPQAPSGCWLHHSRLAG